MCAIKKQWEVKLWKGESPERVPEYRNRKRGWLNAVSREPWEA